MNENLRNLFKTKPTKIELLNLNKLVIYFGDVIVKIDFQERGCCVGKYYKWALDCEVSENSGKDYKTYRDYVLIESLKNNKDIPLDDIFKKYNNSTCSL